MENYLDLIKVFTLYSNTYIAANFEEKKFNSATWMQFDLPKEYYLLSLKNS